MSNLQSVAADNGLGATTLVITIAATTAGSTLVVAVAVDGNQTATVADNKAGGSQTYGTPKVALAASGSQTGYIWTCENSAAGVTQITVTLSSSTDAQGYVAEESGLVSTGNFDNGNSLLNGSGTAFTSNGASATQAGDIAYGLGTNGGVPGFAVSGGWSPLAGTGFTAGTHTNSGAVQMLGGRKVLGAAGSYAFTGTTTSAATAGALVLLLKTPLSAPPASYSLESPMEF